MDTDAPIRYSLNKRASVFLADDSDPFRRVSSQHFEGALCWPGAHARWARNNDIHY